MKKEALSTLSSSASVHAHRGECLHFLRNPLASEGSDWATADKASPDSPWQYIEDGILLVEDGHIAAFGPAAALLPTLPADTTVIEHPNALIIPGMVDTHVHYPQMNIIGAYGAQLLDWLERHTFPEERKFSDIGYATAVAEQFCSELINNGTTTALVFGTVHPESVDAFFSVATEHNMRMICGKVLMDRHAPQWLLDTPASALSGSQELINRWHNKGRLSYAVTPRFAPTSSDEQLLVAAQLITENPDVHLHTHLAENTSECEWVAELYPERRSYLDVYDHFGLLGKRSVFAHGIHLNTTDWQRLHDTDSVIAHCPTSNLFIGSGLFDLASAQQHNVRVGFGTDVGGGDSLSLLRTINEAYKVQQLRGKNLSPFQSLYMATLGGAEALSLHDKIGNFEIGKEADFIVLDYASTPLLASRLSSTQSLQEKLFALQMLGDDRSIRETWIMGRSAKHPQ